LWPASCQATFWKCITTMVNTRTTPKATWKPCTATATIMYTDRARSNRRNVSMKRIGHSRSRMSAKVSSTVLKTSTSGDRRAEFNPADYACAPFVCEHVLPRVGGAGSSMSELAWACPACNSHKYSKTHARDPQSGRAVLLFNPRRQRWSRHFAWSEDYLMLHGRTATGRA